MLPAAYCRLDDFELSMPLSRRGSFSAARDARHISALRLIRACKRASTSIMPLPSEDMGRARAKMTFLLSRAYAAMRLAAAALHIPRISPPHHRAIMKEKPHDTLSDDATPHEARTPAAPRHNIQNAQPLAAITSA